MYVMCNTIWDQAGNKAQAKIYSLTRQIHPEPQDSL